MTRVKRQLRNFEALLALSMTEIIRYGADSPQVIRRLRAALDELELQLPRIRHQAIAGQRKLLEAAAQLAMPPPFEAITAIPDRQGFG